MLELGGFDFQAAGTSNVSPPASISRRVSARVHVRPAAEFHSYPGRPRWPDEPSSAVLRHYMTGPPIDRLVVWKRSADRPAPTLARTGRLRCLIDRSSLHRSTSEIRPRLGVHDGSLTPTCHDSMSIIICLSLCPGLPYSDPGSKEGARRRSRSSSSRGAAQITVTAIRHCTCPGAWKTRAGAK